MRKNILIIAVLLLAFTTFCSCEEEKKPSLDEFVLVNTGSEGIGEETQLRGLTKNKRTFVKEGLILWESSDPTVASVDSDGVVKIKSSGYCEIIGRHKEDMTLSAKYEMFVPYETVPMTEQTRERYTDEQMKEEMWNKLIEFTTSYLYNVVELRKGENNILEIIKDYFIGKGTYLFSTSSSDYSVQNGILYTVSDWGNEKVTFSLGDISSEKIFESVGANYLTAGNQGKSFNDAKSSLESRLVGAVPMNETYRLDLMDPNYEYRIVIKGDYATFTTKNNYSNGLLTGGGITIKEVFKGDLEELENNWCYDELDNEILIDGNVRICIESRLKDAGEAE